MPMMLKQSIFSLFMISFPSPYQLLHYSRERLELCWFNLQWFTKCKLLIQLLQLPNWVRDGMQSINFKNKKNYSKDCSLNIEFSERFLKGCIIPNIDLFISTSSCNQDSSSIDGYCINCSIVCLKLISNLEVKVP